MNQKWDHFLETGAVTDYLSYKLSCREEESAGPSGENGHGKVDSDRYGNVGVACGGI